MTPARPSSATIEPENRRREIHPAEIRWCDDGTPESPSFGDVFFSSEDGLGESRHVFLAGCDLPSAWCGRRQFTIGETGFGSGLNFLAAWQLWRQAGPIDGRLHVLSVEQYPWTRTDLYRAGQLWRELAPLGDTLAARYPAPFPRPGAHTLAFEEDRIRLTLLIGEAADMLGRWEAAIDAWFLDGFAPAANPDMWRPTLLAEIARLSATETRLATFTVAGQVRRDLEAVGFEVHKRPGFGRKRACLAARRSTAQYAANADTRPSKSVSGRLQPWARPPAVMTATPPDAVVIGTGIAGACAAEALARRGAKVTLIERRRRIADGASGNPIGLVSPWVSLDVGPAGRFAAAAFSYAQAFYTRLGDGDGNGDAGGDVVQRRCGTLHLPRTDKDAERYRSLAADGPAALVALHWLERDAATAVCGVRPASGGLFVPDAMMVQPVALIRRLIAQADAAVVPVSAHRLVHSDHSWQVWDADGRIAGAAPLCIIAAAAESRDFAPCAHLPLRPLRGQVTLVDSQERSRALQAILVGDGYLTPAQNGRHLIGADFEPVDLGDGTEHAEAEQPRAEDDAKNLLRLPTLAPDLFEQPRPVGARARIRVACPDRLPVVGAAPQHEAFTQTFAGLARGETGRTFPECPVWPGLFLLTGLGARGLTTAPLSADLLAAQILGNFWPLERACIEAIAPGRFLFRSMKRQAKQK